MLQELTSDTTDNEIKLAFADAWLRNPSDPFKAALFVAKGNTLAALTILDRYKDAPELYDIKAALIEEYGEEEFLPTKEQMIRQVLDRANRAVEDSDYCKLMSLVFDAKGITGKASGPTLTINNNTDNRTMSIPVMINAAGQVASDEEWEQALIQQQRTLVSDHE